MSVLKCLGYGWFILALAILTNWLVTLAGGTTWYYYVRTISELGFWEATISLHLGEALFLFLIYPGLFGLVVYVRPSV